jgi:uncharacterized protein YceK
MKLLLLSLAILLSGCSSVKIFADYDDMPSRIQSLHAKCQQELFKQPDMNWDDATWTCDIIFWDYFCELYPNNPDCE